MQKSPAANPAATVRCKNHSLTVHTLSKHSLLLLLFCTYTLTCDSLLLRQAQRRCCINHRDPHPTHSLTIRNFSHSLLLLMFTHTHTHLQKPPAANPAATVRCSNHSLSHFPHFFVLTYSFLLQICTHTHTHTHTHTSSSCAHEMQQPLDLSQTVLTRSALLLFLF